MYLICIFIIRRLLDSILKIFQVYYAGKDTIDRKTGHESPYGE
jgi:hypothetical protein